MHKEINEIKLKEIIETETGETFNRSGKICCPFHNDKTPSLSVKHNPNRGKDIFKCFGCNAGGDAIDFIMKYRNCSYQEAREYLELDSGKTELEEITEKVENYSNWIIKNPRYNSDVKFTEVLGVFNYTDEFNNYLYSKVKFQAEKGGKTCKELRYYHLENDKVKYGRAPKDKNVEEVPYNFYKVVNVINEGKEIIICEGEKDVETLRHLGFVATSCKSVKNDTYFEKFKGAKVCVIPDNDDAGNAYLDFIKSKIKQDAKSFKVIRLPGIKDIPKGDITDWLELGHSKEEFKKAKKNSLDLNSQAELQQDYFGIYKFNAKKEFKIYITNYSIYSAKYIEFLDENVNGIELNIKTGNGELVTRRGKVTVFDDVRSFKAFLNSMDLTFSGNIADLTRLKEWISRYIVEDKTQIYSGIRLTDDGLVTDKGLISKSGINAKIICTDSVKNKFADTNQINAEELKQLLEQLLNVQPGKYLYSILGTTIHGMMNKIAQENGVKNTIMLIVGESGTGKSTLMKNIIAPILGYGDDYSYKSISSTSRFALGKAFSTTNYPVLGEEFKPSHMSKYKVCEFINVIRDLWEYNSVEKGRKDQSIVRYKFIAPFIFDGEENFPGYDKSVIEKTMIVYLAKNERPQGSDNSIKWIKENKDLMFKLGRSILNYILDINSDEYKKIRESQKDLTDGLEDRIEELYANACTGMYIFNEVCEEIIGADFKRIDYSKDIYNCIYEENVGDLDYQNGAGGITADMLKRFNDIVVKDISDINGERSHYNSDIANSYRLAGDYTYIETKTMVELLHKHNKEIGINEIVLTAKDFNKQCRKNGLAVSGAEGSKAISINGSKIKFIKFNRDELNKIGCSALVDDIYLSFMEELKSRQTIFPV